MELPARTQQVFLRLCCMEEQDRYRYFLRDADDQLAVLAEHGLVEFEGQRVRLLAAAEQAGRAVVDPGFARAVAEEWAANWIASLEVAADVEKPGLLAHAAPYLRRLGRWDELAALEDRLGQHDRAVEAKAEALRRAYEAGDPGEIGTGHHDLAVLLGRLDRASPAVLAHYLASALIAVRTNAPTLGTEIEMIAMFAFAFGLPERIALDDICALAGETGGVRLRELLDRLPQEVPDELQQVVDRAMERAGEAMRDWTPVMTAVVLQASGAADLTGQLETALAGLERGADSAPLARALRRVLAGERGPELLDGLGMLPSGIVGKVLASLRERAGS